MNCCKARERLPDYLDGAVTQTLQDAIAAHLEACAECRQEYRLLAATRSLLSRHGAISSPIDFTYLAARLTACVPRLSPLFWLRRGLVATTAAAALAGVVWQWSRAPELTPGHVPAGVRVKEVAEAEELHQAFAVQQSLDERDGILLFAPRWAERGP
jgi:anti-sigma factor RsiW